MKEATPLEQKIYDFVASVRDEIDGEMSQFLLEQLGMDEQMCKQLIATYDLGFIMECLTERIVNNCK